MYFINTYNEILQCLIGTKWSVYKKDTSTILKFEIAYVFVSENFNIATSDSSSEFIPEMRVCN